MRLYAANSIHQKVKQRRRSVKLARCRYASGTPNQSLQPTAGWRHDPLEFMNRLWMLRKPAPASGS